MTRKISILIAHYNNGKYFKQCYTSLIDQSYTNWEAIIVDDCSTDNSVEIIKQLIKGNIKFLLVENAENKGCGFTKRKCLEYASGDICAFLDPDDALYASALEASIRQYEQSKNIVCTYSKMMLCDENLNAQKVFPQTKQIYNNDLFFNCPIQITHFFTFKKKIYDKTSGINPNLRTAVDQDLYLKILEHGNAKFIKQTLYKYRLHDNGISQNKGKADAKKSFGLVIHDSLKRRKIKYINQNKVPYTFTNPEEIFLLLDYQTTVLYRLKLKLMVLLQA
ncbi:MAG: glycosyltransferase [Sphingobacterium sp.]|jgi:glycosyltransferase involved in cell wall biosynthesis|nr:glycosyltransferase [Sphingobacterium sp.]